MFPSRMPHFSSLLSIRVSIDFSPEDESASMILPLRVFPLRSIVRILSLRLYCSLVSKSMSSVSLTNVLPYSTASFNCFAVDIFSATHFASRVISPETALEKSY